MKAEDEGVELIRSWVTKSEFPASDPTKKKLLSVTVNYGNGNYRTFTAKEWEEYLKGEKND